MPYTDDPENIPSDAIRFLLGDTSLTGARMTDAEVAYLLTEQGGNVLRAAARGAEVLAAKYAGQADEKRVGPLWIRSFRSLSANYLALAQQLWARAAKGAGSGIPWAGGISYTDKAIRASDPDRVSPAFRRRMQHYPDGDSVGGRNFEERFSPPPEIP